MQEKCNKLVDYFQLNLDYFYLQNLESSQIRSSNYFIDYNIHSQYFKKNESDLFCLDLNLDILDKSKEIEYFPSILEIKKLVDSYNFIAIDDDFYLSYLDFGYIRYEEYKHSLEGSRWNIIFEILNAQIVDINLLRSLAIFNDNKYWDFVFPYLYIENLDWYNKPIDEIYKLFFHEKPNIIPQNQSDLENYLFIENKLNEKKVISKYLANYLDEPILYIGNSPTKGVFKAICFSPNLCNKKSLNITFEERIDSKQYAYEYNLMNTEKDFYSEVIQYVKNDIVNFLDKKEYGLWQKFLEVSPELFKLKKKVNQLFNSAIQIIDWQNLNIYSIFHDFDFFDSKKKIALDLSISTQITKSNKLFNKLKKHSINSYILVTPSKIHHIALDQFEVVSENSFKYSKYDDLFYWKRY